MVRPRTLILVAMLIVHLCCPNMADFLCCLYVFYALLEGIAGEKVSGVTVDVGVIPPVGVTVGVPVGVPVPVAVGDGTAVDVAVAEATISVK